MVYVYRPLMRVWLCPVWCGCRYTVAESLWTYRVHGAVVGIEKIAVGLIVFVVCMVKTVAVALRNPICNVRTLTNGVILDDVVGAPELSTIDATGDVVDVVGVGEALVVPRSSGAGGEFAFGTVLGLVVAVTTRWSGSTLGVTGAATVSGSGNERRRGGCPSCSDGVVGRGGGGSLGVAGPTL